MTGTTDSKRKPRIGARPGDTDYLLRDLDITTLRFRVTPSAREAVDPVEEATLAFIRERPGSTVSEIAAQVPAVNGWEYNRVRALVVGMVDKSVLTVDGNVPLEEVDGRYERVAKCDLCGSPSTRHEIVFWKHNTPVVRCSECGLLYANPRWKAEHLFGRYNDGDYWAEYADKIQPTALDPATNLARWSPYIMQLESIMQKGRLLDVGCASGEFLVAAQSHGWEVYGMEPASQAAEQARRATGARIEVGTLADTSYPDGYFDAITLWDVLEHLQSPKECVAGIARLLRPGGVLSLTTPNIRSGAYKLLGVNWHVIGPNEHIYYFSPRTLSRLLTENGFAIHVMRTFYTPVDIWRQWLRNPALDPLARLLYKASLPVSERYLLGDELYVVARRR